MAMAPAASAVASASSAGEHGPISLDEASEVGPTMLAGLPPQAAGKLTSEPQLPPQPPEPQLEQQHQEQPTLQPPQQQKARENGRSRAGHVPKGGLHSGVDEMGMSTAWKHHWTFDPDAPQ